MRINKDTDCHTFVDAKSCALSCPFALSGTKLTDLEDLDQHEVTRSLQTSASTSRPCQQMWPGYKEMISNAKRNPMRKRQRVTLQNKLSSDIETTERLQMRPDLQRGHSIKHVTCELETSAKFPIFPLSSTEGLSVSMESETCPLSSAHTVEKTPTTLQHSQLNGIYKREFPSNGLIAFSSSKGRKMLQEAMAKGSAEVYFPLAEQFLTQSDPPSCGPATIAMVLNSLMVDPQKVWKAPWRWFAEDMLQSCGPMDLSNGVTMEEFECLATCNYLDVQTYHAEDELRGLDDFRREIRRVSCDSSGSLRIVASFSRASLDQTGSGHYSPIGAYHEESDAVLILDVARFKYPPYWVSLKRLWAAMAEFDPLTSKPRGFFVLGRKETSQHESSEIHSCGRGRCITKVYSSMTSQMAVHVH